MPDSHEMDHPAKPFFALFVAVDDSSAQNPNPSSKPPTPRSFDDGSVGLGIVAAADSSAQNPNPSPKPPTSRSFDDGSVGLGIIAAMVGAGPARSGPIPIVSARSAAMWRRPIEELSERYTTGGMPVRKMVYLDGGGGDGDGGDRCSVASFLSCCYLCRKDLNGLDIFMYSIVRHVQKSKSLILFKCNHFAESGYNLSKCLGLIKDIGCVYPDVPMCTDCPGSSIAGRVPKFNFSTRGNLSFYLSPRW